MIQLTEIARTNYPGFLKQLFKAGMRAVSNKNLAKLKTAAALIESSNFPTAKVTERIYRLKKQLPKDCTSSFQADIYYEILHWGRLIQPSYQKWQMQQIKFFNDPLWWDRFASQIEYTSLEKKKDIAKLLNHLKRTWLSQSRYAHYSTLDLLNVYKVVIPVFSEWLRYAKIELKKRKKVLTPELLKKYQKYLSEFEKALEEEKTCLRTCLYGRLSIGVQKGHAAQDNLIVAIRDELKKVGVLAEEPKLEKAIAYGYMTPEAFVLIRNIIEEEGKESEKKALYELPYFGKASTGVKEDLISLKFNNPFDNFSLLRKFYFHLPGFLQWFFWNIAVWEQFFQHPHHQFLLAQNIAFLEDEVNTSNITVENLLINFSSQQNNMCLNLLLSEWLRLEEWLRHPLAFLFPETVKELSNYKNFLNQSADKWVMKQLAFIQSAMENKKEESWNVDEKSTLRRIFQLLEMIKNNLGFSENVLSIFSSLWLNYQLHCGENLEKSEKNEFLKDSERISLLPLNEQLREELRKAVRVFEAGKKKVNRSVKVLKNLLERDPSICSGDLLRIEILDYLKKFPDLPGELKDAVQGILAQKNFSQTALNLEKTAINKLEENLEPSLLISASNDRPYPDLEEDPWEYEINELEKHCQKLKNYLDNGKNILCTDWNETLVRYTLRFLNHINNLNHWNIFILYRSKILFLLQTLIDISQPTFFVLSQSLLDIVRENAVLEADRWIHFKKITLHLSIRTLERFIQIHSGSILQDESASYRSQKELNFVSLAEHPVPFKASSLSFSPAIKL